MNPVVPMKLKVDNEDTFRRANVLPNCVERYVVETKLAKLAVDTKFTKLAVETKFAKFAVDIKLARFVVVCDER